MEKTLPKSWVESVLENLFNLSYGKGLKVDQLTGEGYDVYGANGIIGKYSEYTYEDPQVIISCRGAASGAIHKTNPKSFITSNSIVIERKSIDIINLNFVKYAMTAVDKTEVITGTAQPQITIQLLKDLKIQYPPLPEQQRIVAKLDSLFAHLETVKQRMEKVPELLKQFRQAVLMQAVTGRLTEGKKWSKNTIENITNKVGSGSTPSGGQSAYQDFGTPLVRSMNIHFNGIKNEGLAYLNESQAHNLRSVTIEEGDVLLNITGASIGRVCLAEEQIIGGRVNQHVSIVRANKSVILPKFLNISLSSPIVQSYISAENYGVTRQALTKGQLLSLEISYPPLEEQTEIVSRVERLFAKADAIEARYAQLKAQVDKLPQALLTKAFRGELV